MKKLNDSSSVDVRSKSVQLKLKAEKEEKKREVEKKKILQQQNQKRDNFNREEKFAESSKRRGWDEWQTWCKEVKIDELRNDLKIVSKSVARLLDKTENTIETIQTHREHADEQYLRNFQSHYELIDYFMNLFKVFKDSADQMYERERERLVCDFYRESSNRDSILHHRKTFYENVAHATVTNMKCDMNQMSEDFIERKFEIEADSFIKREELCNQAKKREAIACSEVRSLINVFNTNWWPKSRYNQYQKSLKKSLESDKILKELQRKYQHSVKTISKLDKELQISTRECQRTIAEHRSEHRFMARLKQQIEEKIKHESLYDQEQVIRLVSVCENVKNKLKKTLARAKRIESAMKVCKKFEKFSDEFIELENSEAFTIDLFLEKLSKVEADCVVLRKFKADLTAKNKTLEEEINSKRH